MKQPRGNRVINGVFFTVWSTYAFKPSAQNEARILRKKGNLVRIVKSKEKGIKYPWVVYYGVK